MPDGFLLGIKSKAILLRAKALALKTRRREMNIFVGISISKVKSSTTIIKVRGYDLDVYQHVNNARYLEYLEAARWDYIEKYFEPGVFEKNNWGITVARVNIRYRQPAHFGDILEVVTQGKERNRISCTLRQLITRQADGKKVADAEVTFVLTDLTTGRAIAIDDRIGKFLEDGVLEE